MARHSENKSKKTDKQKTENVKRGRPTLFTQELADLICLRVATSSFGIRKLCSMYDDLPAVDTIYEWRYKYRSFSEQYAEAKLKQADYMAEELLEIADEGTNDWMQSLGEDGQPEGWKLNGEHIARSRLRVDTRKWLASKLLPKQYGDKQTIEQHVHSHEDKLKELK